MSSLANVLIFVVGLLHIWFMVLEMVFWTKPLGLKAFRLTPEKAQITKQLAMNQGLYNGFLAAGLIWASLSNDLSLKVFFLTCVMLAGIVGGITVSKKIITIQFLPALLALVLIFVNFLF